MRRRGCCGMNKSINEKEKLCYFANRALHGNRVFVKRRNGSIYPLHRICRHSPDGFEWGYGGSGPADLALSILTDAVGKELAEKHYQTLKWAVIADLPFEDWRIAHSLVAALIASWESGQGGRRKWMKSCRFEVWRGRLRNWPQGPLRVSRILRGRRSTRQPGPTRMPPPAR